MEGNHRLTEADFFIQLQKIVKMSEIDDEAPVGILTSINRDQWAEARLELISGTIIQKCTKTISGLKARSLKVVEQLKKTKCSL